MWIFLSVLQVFLNLNHYVRAQLLDDGTVVLYGVGNARDQVKIDDPRDIASLRNCFEVNGLTPLVVEAPPPAEAATEVEASTGTQVDAPDEASLTNEPASPAEAATEVEASTGTQIDAPDQAGGTGEPAAAEVSVATDKEPAKPSSPFLGRR